MWASNAKDEFNANMFTEWQPGRVEPVNLWTGTLWRRSILNTVIFTE